jgi:hypothetical protein
MIATRSGCTWRRGRPQYLGTRGVLDVGLGAADERGSSHNAQEPWAVAARKKAWAKLKTAKVRAKRSAAMRGEAPPRSVIEAARLTRLGTKHTAETRRKMSETHRRRWRLTPRSEAWTKAEDALLRRLPASEVARRTNRSIQGVKARRRRLGIPDGRRRGTGKTSRWAALDVEGRLSRRTADSKASR